MEKYNDIKKEDYFMQRNSGKIITYVGFSFIIVGIFNFVFKIPSEYIVGVSFAAFFFVCADFIFITKQQIPFAKSLYSFSLYLAVLSFTALPILLPAFEKIREFLVTSSESLTIISLGVVLVVINLRMFLAEHEYFQNLEKLFLKNEEYMEDYKKITQEYEDMTKEAQLNTAKAQKLAEATHEMNSQLVKMIKEEDDIQVLREKL